jgi:hypothetical protein
MLNSTTAQALIAVKPHAITGEREVVTYNPQAESIHPVRVIESKNGKQIPGRICCLRFNAAGQLVGVLLCNGTRICIKLHDERIQKLLELARDKNLSVTIHVDEQGCLTDLEICR